MKPECIKLAKELAGDVLKDEDLSYLEESIKSHLKDTPSNLSRAERLKLAGEKALQSRIEDTARFLHTSIDEAFKRQKITDYVASYKPGIYGKTKALSNKLFYRAGSPQVSLEKLIETATNSVLESYAPYIKETGKYFGFVQDPKISLDVIRELKGLDTGNAVARGFAKHHTKVMKEQHANGQLVGHHFDFRENRVPQPTDPYKLQTKGEQAYVNDLYNLVDHSKLKNLDGTPWTRDQFVKRASESFKTLLNGKGKERIGYGGKVGEKRRHQREFEFKDAESHMEYLDKYGTTTHVGELLTSDLRSLIKENTLAEHLGLNADAFIRKSFAEAYKADSLASAGLKDQKEGGVLGYGQKNILDAELERSLLSWDVLQNGNRPDSVVWDNVGSGTRAMASAVLLGKHPIDALLEDGMLVRQMHKRMGITDEIKKSILNMDPEIRKAFLSDVALYGEGVISIGVRTGVDTNAINFASTLSDLVQKASGSHFLDKHNREISTLVISNQVGMHVDKYPTLEALFKSDAPKEIKQAFKSFTSLDYDVMKQAGRTRGADGLYSLIAPQHIHDIDNAKLSHLVKDATKEKTAFYEQSIKEAGSKLEKEIDASLAKTEGKPIKELAKADKELLGLDERIKGEGTKVSKKITAVEKEYKLADEAYKKAIHTNNTVADRAIKRNTKRLSEIDIEFKAIPEQSKTYFEKKDKLRKAIIADIDKTKAKRDTTPKNLLKFEKGALEHVVRRKNFNIAIDKKYAQLKELDATVAKKDKEFKKQAENLRKERDRLKADNEAQTAKRDVPPPKALQKRDKLFSQLEEMKNPTYRTHSQNKLSEQYTSKHSEAEKLRKHLSDKRQELTAKGQESVNKYVEGLKQKIEELRSGEIQKLKNTTANKLRGFISTKNQIALRGAVSPTLLEKHRLGFLTYKAGTLQGEMLRMLMQFHVTPFGLYFTHMKDLPESGKMPEGSGLNIQNIRGSFAATTALAGIATEIIKMLLRGEDPNAVEAMKKGTLGNGSLFPPLNMIMPALERRSVTDAMGAVPSILGQMGSSIKRGLKGKAGFGQTVGETTRHITPFMNMWYTNAPYEHLFYGKMMDWFNPNYMSDKQKRQERHGKSFFWNKDEALPSRLPTVKGY